MRDKTHRPGGDPTGEIFAQVVEKQVRLAKLLTVAALFFVKVRENWTRAPIVCSIVVTGISARTYRVRSPIHLS
jgi:hypothetical protein